MREFEATVVDIRDEGLIAGRRRWRILLTEPLFDDAEAVLVAVSPGGARLEIPVLDVHGEGAERWVIAGKPLAAGTSVLVRVFDEDQPAG